jgi:hypothetical protein
MNPAVTLTPEEGKRKQEFMIWSTDEEIRLRGTFIKYAANFEVMVDNIISKTLPTDKLREEFRVKAHVTKDKRKKWYEYSLANKIKIVEKCIEEHFPHLYPRYKNAFATVTKFKKLRNDLAHGTMFFDFIAEDRETVQIVTTDRGYKKQDLKISELWKQVSDFQKSYLLHLPDLRWLSYKDDSALQARGWPKLQVQP